jgi:hypothetical protein
MAKIIQYARILGVGGEVLVERLLTLIEEQAGQSLAVMKMIEGYVSKLGKEAAPHKLSLDLEEEAAPERQAQLEEMEAEVGRLPRALEEANMDGITHGHRALRDQLDRYYRGLDAARDGEKVSSDPTGFRKSVELT